jgi:prepilin-type processing-associated H-X9-DG protein
VQYADDNGDRIVNSSAGFSKNKSGFEHGSDQPSWLDTFNVIIPHVIAGNLDAAEAGMLGPSEVTQVGNVTVKGTNVLYKFAPDIRLYKCPTMPREGVVSYQIVDRMNGAATWGNAKERGLGGDAIRIRTEIRRPGESIVWVCSGFIDFDSWTVYYDRASWWDKPPVRHGKGTNWAFADGHVEYHKWLEKNSLDFADALQGYYYAGQSGLWNGAAYQNREGECDKDLMWTQFHCWGEFGYSVSECPAESLPF